MPFIFQPLDETAARAVVAWRYPPPYEVYNEEPGREQQVVQELLRPDYHYYRIAEGGDPLVAYCCFTLDARVAGGDYALDAVDLGLMVRPDLNGQGRGGEFARAVLAFAQRTFPQRLWRVTIAEFNQRAQRVWQKLGFRRVQTFARRGDGLTFGVWVKDEAADEAPSDARESQKGRGAPAPSAQDTVSNQMIMSRREPCHSTDILRDRIRRVWKKGFWGNGPLCKRRNSTVYGMVMATESSLQGLPEG
jgi:RimJ/RimL family protein N-acetyltransferase